jgi:carboxyl-terminal processing protease
MVFSILPGFRTFAKAAVFVFLLSGPASALAQSASSRLDIQKLVEVMQIIDLAYVDSVDMDDVVSGAIEKSLRDLDPHSAYIPAEEVEKANEPLEGSFEGIGVSFQVMDDTILVISPTPGGPSEKLGILSGDKIVKIDGVEATGDTINSEWVFKKLRGKKGTIVEVSVYRKGKKDLLDFRIVRDKIPLNSIDASFMADDMIGYVRLNRFSKTSMEEFNEALTRLKAEGMKKLILDLRGNSGGFLNTAVELADEFLSTGRLIVYTEGLHSPRQDFNATTTGGFETGRLVVIIDEASASASEIVAGAVQDWDRGLVIGRRSFGKGLVQRPFNLRDGSVVRLTTARYYTPSGRSIQRPYENGTEEYYDDFSERFEHGEYLHADSIKFPDSLRYTTKQGRVVFGGGGIMPDVFIPWDSTMFSDYYVEIRRKGTPSNKISM